MHACMQFDVYLSDPHIILYKTHELLHRANVKSMSF